MGVCFEKKNSITYAKHSWMARGVKDDFESRYHRQQKAKYNKKKQSKKQFRTYSIVYWSSHIYFFITFVISTNLRCRASNKIVERKKKEKPNLS